MATYNTICIENKHCTDFEIMNLKTSIFLFTTPIVLIISRQQHGLTTSSMHRHKHIRILSNTYKYHKLR